MNGRSEGSGKRGARVVLVTATAAIALGYSGAFISTPAPAWAPWLLALGIPASLGGIIVLGAARGRDGARRLTIPIAIVVATVALGFSLALALPANEGVSSALWLGLPARAAIVVYGIGILPAIVLPLAYALTFETHTLSTDDVRRVREMGEHRGAMTERDAG